MATVRQLGVNTFIFVKVASTYQLIGCADKFSADRSADIKKYLCQATGNTSQKVPGERTVTATLGGVHMDYTSGEETTNWSYKDWCTAFDAGTVLEFFVGANTTTGTSGEKFTAVVSKVGSENAVGDISKWDVSLDINGSIETFTIA
jgi:hypothetical protein